MKTIIDRKRMQQALNGLAAAHNRAMKWRTIVAKYSEQQFGCDPGDVDNDFFIDTNDGGCGECTPMSVDDFDASMRANIEMQNTQ